MRKLRAIRALPTLLRIGVAETVAYRAEFVVWMLTATMPLIMLGLWTSVAREAPFRGYGSADFVAYYLAALIVRNLTGNWVAWQMSEDIRMGTMSMRLLRPIHPFIAYAAGHAAALPFRSMIALPVALILLVSSGRSALTTDQLQLALVLPSIGLAWLLTFGFMFMLGSLAFWFTETFAVANFYFVLFSLFSGYLLPMELMPHWIAVAASYMPFRSMLGAPVELMTRHLETAQVVRLIAGQAIWSAIGIALSLLVWRAGVRKFEAVGG